MQLQAEPVIAAVYPTAAGCRRKGSRGDLLGPWIDAIGVSVGDPLILDELVTGAWYGLRQPGHLRIYDVTRAPEYHSRRSPHTLTAEDTEAYPGDFESRAPI